MNGPTWGEVAHRARIAHKKRRCSDWIVAQGIDLPAHVPGKPHAYRQFRNVGRRVPDFSACGCGAIVLIDGDE